MAVNYLQAVFWDYPELAGATRLREFIEQHRDPPVRNWVLARFLECGRFKETTQFFSLGEIARRLPVLKISRYARRKWTRFVEVYAPASGK